MPLTGGKPIFSNTVALRVSADKFVGVIPKNYEDAESMQAMNHLNPLQFQVYGCFALKYDFALSLA